MTDVPRTAEAVLRKLLLDDDTYTDLWPRPGHHRGGRLTVDGHASHLTDAEVAYLERLIAERPDD